MNSEGLPRLQIDKPNARIAILGLRVLQAVARLCVRTDPRRARAGSRNRRRPLLRRGAAGGHAHHARARRSRARRPASATTSKRARSTQRLPSAGAGSENVPELAYALLGQGQPLEDRQTRGGGAVARGARPVRVDRVQARARRDRGAARAEPGRGPVTGSSIRRRPCGDSRPAARLAAESSITRLGAAPPRGACGLRADDDHTTVRRFASEDLSRRTQGPSEHGRGAPTTQARPSADESAGDSPITDPPAKKGIVRVSPGLIPFPPPLARPGQRGGRSSSGRGRFPTPRRARETRVPRRRPPLLRRARS
jgi:hypothetical protein